MKLYVGNLPSAYGDKDLEDLCAPFGTVKSAKVIIDRETGRSKRFGFVELSSKEEGQKAIDALDKKAPQGFKDPLTVNEARPLEKREGGSPFRKNYR